MPAAVGRQSNYATEHMRSESLAETEMADLIARAPSVTLESDAWRQATKGPERHERIRY